MSPMLAKPGKGYSVLGKVRINSMEPTSFEADNAKPIKPDAIEFFKKRIYI